MPQKKNISGLLTWPLRSWLVFYAFSIWLFVSVMLLSGIPMQFLYEQYIAENEQNSNEIKVLLENENPDKKVNKKRKYFLSDEDATAQGKLTQEKEFSAISRDHKLSLPKKGTLPEERVIKILKNQEFKKMDERGYIAKIVKEQKQAAQKGAPKGMGFAPNFRVPANYNFRDEFALSWDANGNPRIPTRKYEHYAYFRKMLDKIQNNWAPPGGNPSPVYGDAYHRMSYIPGTMRYAAFPSQDIRLVFVLDDTGKVHDVKIQSSLGYKSLNTSCVEAIERSRNFGPPPQELLQSGRLIVPMIFRIIVR